MNIFQKIYIFFFATKVFAKNIAKTTKKTLYIFMKACYNIKCKLKKALNKYHEKAC